MLPEESYVCLLATLTRDDAVCVGAQALRVAGNALVTGCHFDDNHPPPAEVRCNSTSTLLAWRVVGDGSKRDFIIALPCLVPRRF